MDPRPWHAPLLPWRYYLPLLTTCAFPQRSFSPCSLWQTAGSRPIAERSVLALGKSLQSLTAWDQSVWPDKKRLYVGSQKSFAWPCQREAGSGLPGPHSAFQAFEHWSDSAPCSLDQSLPSAGRWSFLPLRFLQDPTKYADHTSAWLLFPDQPRHPLIQPPYQGSFLGYLRSLATWNLEDWDLSDRPKIPGSENDRQIHPHHRSGPLPWLRVHNHGSLHLTEPSRCHFDRQRFPWPGHRWDKNSWQF